MEEVEYIIDIYMQGNATLHITAVCMSQDKCHEYIKVTCKQRNSVLLCEVASCIYISYIQAHACLVTLIMKKSYRLTCLLHY